MDHVRFETLKREIAAHATVDQLIDLEAQTARLLSERVSEALVARRAVEVAHDRGTCSTSLPVPIALSFVRMSMKALGKT